MKGGKQGYKEIDLYSHPKKNKNNCQNYCRESLLKARMVLTPNSDYSNKQEKATIEI